MWVRTKWNAWALLFLIGAVLIGCGGEPPAAIESTPTMIQLDLAPILTQIGPYDFLTDLPARVPAGFFDAYPAEALVRWSDAGLQAAIPFEDSGRPDYFHALDLALVGSGGNRYAPLHALRRESELRTSRALSRDAAPGKLTVYKMYNNGVILRTPDVCIGIDIILDLENSPLAAYFASRLDGLLVSHNDLDHYDINGLVPEMDKLGKPVVRPKDNPAVTLGDALDTGTISGAAWTALKGGHYDLRYSAYYLIEIGRWRILHSGDNAVWPQETASAYDDNIDLMFVTMTIIDETLPEMLARIRPRTAVPQHMLEIGHGLEGFGHDIAIRLVSEAPKGTAIVMMAWGEAAAFDWPTTAAARVLVE